VALRDDILLVGDVGLLDVLEDDILPVAGLGVDPALVEFGESDADGAKILGGLGD
jgi:hypothetical protein